MSKTLKVLFVCSEMSPLAGTGGLAEVANALPGALRAHGHDVRVALPLYRCIPEQCRGHRICDCTAKLADNKIKGTLYKGSVPVDEMPLYLVEHKYFFDREHLYGENGDGYRDNVARFSFFCQALLDGIAKSDWIPDIVHCNDWHTAVLPAYIKTILSRDPIWSNMPILFTIHNLAYQGRSPAHELPLTGLSSDLFHLKCLEFYGDLNIMKAGIAFASKINVVSPSYAKEILHSPEMGMGLDGFLLTRENDLSGILNGVDYNIWNPVTDPIIEANYSVEDISNKSVCKAALQKHLGLPQKDVPLFGMVTRLDRQKGVDILIRCIRRFVRRDLQIAILGSGDEKFEDALEKAAEDCPDKISFSKGFDIPLSHRIVAGSDFFLMPSRFEPCGLSQMYSMAYGTIPIVRSVGGLADTVRHVSRANIAKERATGIVFYAFSAETLARSVRSAIELYKDKATMHALRINGMKKDFSWDRSSKAYIRLYRKAINKP